MKPDLKKYISWLLISGMLLVLLGCSSGGSQTSSTASDLKTITAYSLNGNSGTINGNNIDVIVPFGTDVTALIATFTTTGTSVTVESTVQVSGTTPNNFTDPVAYTVTAADGSTNTYTVTATPPLISKYSLNGISAVINGRNITVTVPHGTNVAGLIATFKTNGLSITVGGKEQVSGVTSNDFTKPVLYKVTTAKEVSHTYLVTVDISTYFIGYHPTGCTPHNEAAGVSGNCACVQDPVTGYIWTTTLAHSNHQCYNSLMDKNGKCDTSPDTKGYVPNLNGNNTCGLSSGWSLPSVGLFSKMASYVADQSNGTRGDWFNNNGFTDMKNDGYFVGECASGTVCTLPAGGNGGYVWWFGTKLNTLYTYGQGASLSNTYGWGVNSSLANRITEFYVNGRAGTISGHNIDVVLPQGTNVTSMVATFKTNGIDITSITVGDEAQISGVTPNNFTNPVMYKVTKADGVTDIYTVKVTASPTYFLAYYPKGCTPNNAAVLIPGNCECVQDPSTGDVWTTARSDPGHCYNSLIDKKGVCDGGLGTKGYIPNLNSNKICGLIGWNLPTKTQLLKMSSYSVAEFDKWFIHNGFKGIYNDGYDLYIGQPADIYSNNVWASYLTGRDDNMRSVAKTYSTQITYGWGVNTTQTRLTAYSLNGVFGTISDDNNISVTMPYGTNLTSLIATFATDGTRVTVENVTQINGVTPNNFTHPVVYLITANKNGNIYSVLYTVTVHLSE